MKYFSVFVYGFSLFRAFSRATVRVHVSSTSFYDKQVSTIAFARVILPLLASCAVYFDVPISSLLNCALANPCMLWITS